MSDRPKIREFRIVDDGTRLEISFRVENDTAQTVYCYRDARGVQYDEVSKTLRVLLTDRHVVEGPVRFIAADPPLLAVDPGESESVTLSVARIITRLGPQKAGQRGPSLVQAAVHEAASVEIEVSWSDRPFYRERGTKRTPVEQIQRWERGVLQSKIERTPKGDSPGKSGRRRS